MTLAHALKPLNFGALFAAPGALDPVAAGGAVLATLLGTALAQPLLAAMSETTYRRWAGRIIATIALAYVTQGTALLVWPG